MSQSPHPTDNQALLQSMLQRLKLQSGRDGQSVFQTAVSPSVAPALGQNSERGAPSLQEVDNRPLNVFSFNGNPSKEFTVPSTNNTSGFKSVEKQQAGPAFEGSRSPTFFPSQKVSTDGESGEKRELGHAPKPGFSPTATRQLFSAKPQKEVKLTFFKRTDVEKESIGSSLMTGQIAANTHTVSDMTPNQNHVPVLMSTDSGLAGGGSTGFLVGNGGISSSEQSFCCIYFKNIINTMLLKHGVVRGVKQIFVIKLFSFFAYDEAGSLSSSSSSSIQKMEESVEPQQETVSPSHEQRSHPIPLSPTSFSIYASPPRSVLRHSLSHDSESSMETMTKRVRCRG
ncbi:hypothetical protein XENOCAPTIV_030092 [Xenoophorus captivus]|uniref:Uncharacterized protein n=1 Tax=Xenoophorus captivus TaxID=1517983 RepID=A0ABV0QKA9_9TELE